MSKGRDAAVTFVEDFLRFVTQRVSAVERAMPGCDIEEYQTFSAQHSCLYGELYGRLSQGDRELLAEFDSVSEALAAFDTDNSYMQGFADGINFMGLFKKV